MMLSMTLLKGGTGSLGGDLGTHTSAAAGMGFARAHHSGPQSINFCYDLHCPYDCNTFLFTLNCLEIKTKDKIKKKSFSFCPLGLIVPGSNKSHICV